MIFIVETNRQQNRSPVPGGKREQKTKRVQDGLGLQGIKGRTVNALKTTCCQNGVTTEPPQVAEQLDMVVHDIELDTPPLSDKFQPSREYSSSAANAGTRERRKIDHLEVDSHDLTAQADSHRLQHPDHQLMCSLHPGTGHGSNKPTPALRREFRDRDIDSLKLQVVINTDCQIEADAFCHSKTTLPIASTTADPCLSTNGPWYRGRDCHRIGLTPIEGIHSNWKIIHHTSMPYPPRRSA